MISTVQQALSLSRSLDSSTFQSLGMFLNCCAAPRISHPGFGFTPTAVIHSLS